MSFSSAKLFIAMLRYIHIVFGLALFVIFLITGQYMRFDFPDKEVISQDLRLLMRSRHIYILFAALMNVGLGLYLSIRPSWWEKAFQIVGSMLLIISGCSFVWAFIAETYYFMHFSEISRYAIYFSLAGIAFHFFGGFRWRDPESN